MKKISFSLFFLFVLIAHMQYTHASIDSNWDTSIDPNWDSAWDQRTEICVSSDTFENPDVDIEIQNLFASTQLARKFLRYEIDGQFFYVLLIHNPDKLNLKSEISINTSKHGLINSTLNYDKKVGIFVNKEAPRKLIDHLSKLQHLSWWDSWWELAIANGTKVSIEYTDFEVGLFSNGYTIYTYTGCTYYTALKKATL